MTCAVLNYITFVDCHLLIRCGVQTNVGAHPVHRLPQQTPFHQPLSETTPVVVRRLEGHPGQQKAVRNSSTHVPQGPRCLVSSQSRQLFHTVGRRYQLVWPQGGTTRLSVRPRSSTTSTKTTVTTKQVNKIIQNGYMGSLKGQRSLLAAQIVYSFLMSLWVLIVDISLQNQTHLSFEPLEQFTCGLLHKRLISSSQSCVVLMSRWSMIHSQLRGPPLHTEMYKNSLHMSQALVRMCNTWTQENNQDLHTLWLFCPII